MALLAVALAACGGTSSKLSDVEHQLVDNSNFTATADASSARCTDEGRYLDGERFMCSLRSGNEQQTDQWLLTAAGVSEISGGGAAGFAPQTATDAAERLEHVAGQTNFVSCLPNPNSGAGAYTCLIGNTIFETEWAADGTLTRFALQSP